MRQPTAETAGTPASDAQVSLLRQLASRLDRIQMFDSIGSSGPAEAASIRGAITAGITKSAASELIATAQTLIKDEMEPMRERLTLTEVAAQLQLATAR